LTKVVQDALRPEHHLSDIKPLSLATSITVIGSGGDKLQ
jgi:hypothetical protein